MGLVTRGPSTAIRLLMNVICDKLKADYFLEGEAESLAPGPSAGGDGLGQCLHYGPVPTDCRHKKKTQPMLPQALSASYQDAIS